MNGEDSFVKIFFIQILILCAVLKLFEPMAKQLNDCGIKEDSIFDKTVFSTSTIMSMYVLFLLDICMIPFAIMLTKKSIIKKYKYVIIQLFIIGICFLFVKNYSNYKKNNNQINNNESNNNEITDDEIFFSYWFICSNIGLLLIAELNVTDEIEEVKFKEYVRKFVIFLVSCASFILLIYKFINVFLNVDYFGFGFKYTIYLIFCLICYKMALKKTEKRDGFTLLLKESEVSMSFYAMTLCMIYVLLYFDHHIQEL